MITEKENLIKIAALLIHAAKIDDHYSKKEKSMISDFIESINNNLDPKNIIEIAEKDENDSNQILKYNQALKKNPLEFKKKIIKILWKIILSDNNSDIYEGNLMRRLCGLLYLPDKLSGDIKLEVIEEKKL